LNKSLEKMKYAHIIFSFFLIVFGAFDVHAALNSGEISGSVEIEEKGHVRPIKNLSVRLRIFKKDYQVAGAEAITDRRGNYRFRNLNTDLEYIYLVRAKYEGISYPPLPVRFSSSQRRVKLRPFRVYPSINQPKNIDVSENLFLEFGKTEEIMPERVRNVPVKVSKKVRITSIIFHVFKIPRFS